MEAHRRRSGLSSELFRSKGHVNLQQVIENLTNAISKIPWPQHATVALASAVKAEGLTERDQALWLSGSAPHTTSLRPFYTFFTYRLLE
jgi:hypothetical protein